MHFLVCVPTLPSSPSIAVDRGFDLRDGHSSKADRMQQSRLGGGTPISWSSIRDVTRKRTRVHWLSYHRGHVLRFEVGLTERKAVPAIRPWIHAFPGEGAADFAQRQGLCCCCCCCCERRGEPATWSELLVEMTEPTREAREVIASTASSAAHTKTWMYQQLGLGHTRLAMRRRQSWLRARWRA
jgi:hypothetical protein